MAPNAEEVAAPERKDEVKVTAAPMGKLRDKDQNSWAKGRVGPRAR